MDVIAEAIALMLKDPETNTEQAKALVQGLDFGEAVEDALTREVREELGLASFSPVFVSRYLFASERERELVHVFAAVVSDVGSIRPSEELDGGRFWNIDEIETSMGKGIFTPNFENEYTRVLKHSLHELEGLPRLS